MAPSKERKFLTIAMSPEQEELILRAATKDCRSKSNWALRVLMDSANEEVGNYQEIIHRM